jgi:hypothetical protein
MAENVACYLAHLRGLGVTLPTQDSQKGALKAINGALQEAGSPVAGEPYLKLAGKLRWLSKLQRDIQAPYSDSQVGARLDTCCNDLQKILPHFSKIPHQLFLVGGPLASGEGRFGAHSDLDLVLAVDPQHRAQADQLVAQLSPAAAARKDTVQVYVTSTSQLPEVLEYFGNHAPLVAADPLPQVQQAVREGLQSQGLHIKHDLKRFPSQLLTPLKA